ncbi:HEPN domain-containing protein [Streptomyces sp. NBC_00474]|uniref:ApeA N-terminal domain 1-containing protein n=1 Tax=Streptomyces sp. NBC_00474 TaxID=2975754 RepID=UPI00225A1769|nr:HEPN domain-containing protein [Streptomyces sp. NBC_00474]MCX5055118.1 hypothetical protein [Streptomyces sp. NBC_00474]
MKDFELEGTWWLPGREGEPLSGTLSFSKDRSQLKVYGPLHPLDLAPSNGLRPMAAKSVTEPVVYGTTRQDQRVTLFEVHGLYLPGMSSSEETYTPGLILIGDHAENETFTEVQVELEYLHDWASVPDLVKFRDRQFCFSAAQQEALSTQSGDDVIKVLTSLLGNCNGTAVDFKQHSMVSVTTSTGREWREIFEEKVRPLHDLMIVSLGRPLAMDALYLRPDTTNRERGVLCDAYLDVLRPASRPGSIFSYSAPTLYTAADHDLGEVVSKWYASYSTIRPILTLLLNPYYAPFIYGEHRFASIFQALEALHKEFFESRDMEKAQHSARVKGVIDGLSNEGVPADTVEWAKRILTGRNDKPLRQQVQEVVESSGPLGCHILEALPQFSRTVAGARTGVSHGGAKPMNSSDRYWLGEVLLWVLRAKILTEIGIPGMYEKVLTRDRYIHAIEQIHS